jgi:dipeptidyl aminopeptidase/acylaminoacyl peptidase
MRARSPLLFAPSLGLALFMALGLGCEETPAPVAPPPPAPPPAETAPAPPVPAPPPPPHADASLLPRKLLFGNPDRLPPKLSPDGKRILFIAPDGGVLNVWVGPADDPKAAKVVTHERARPIRDAHWAETGAHVIYANDKGGDENFHLFVVDLATGQERDLTPFDGMRAEFGQTFDAHPAVIFALMNKRDKQHMDPVLIDIKTGKIEVLSENTQGYEGYVVDEATKLRLGVLPLPDGTKDIQALGKKGEWKSIGKIPYEDALTTWADHFDRSGKTLYLGDSRGRDTSALVAYDVASGKTHVLFEDAKSDVSAVEVDSKTLRPVMVATNRARREWHTLDKRVEGDLEALRKVTDGDLRFFGASRDDQRWTVGYVKDDGPMPTYLWDRKAKKATLLYTTRPALEGVKLSKMRPVTIKSRDGLDLVSYLTLPRAADADQDGKPDAGPIPMVLLVHGGPWGRDEWGFDSTHQWLANRGYAVLSVNFRASTGFGKSFLNAGDLQWAGKMHDDLLDAVKWAVDQKVADPQKVAIVGGSYGGYSTLIGLTFTPDVFACGVDLVGPSNLVTLLETVPPYWAPLLNEFRRRIGDNRTDEGKKFLFEHSALSRADAIKRPLLIGQGANDPRVKQAESDQIVKAMQAKGLPVTYVLYPDEGHGFARPENRTSFNAVTETFLAQHLGGSYEPVGSDFAGATITVPSGADQVYGLVEALPKKP